MIKANYLIYLSGPIAGCTREEATNWRDEVALMLPSQMTALSPMRHHNHLFAKLSMDEVEANPDVLATQRAIMYKDHYDCTRADGIIVNLLGTTKVSIGTVKEMAWAYDRRIPMVVAMESGNIHDHCMVREETPFIVPTLKEAVNILVDVMMP